MGVKKVIQLLDKLKCGKLRYSLINKKTKQDMTQTNYLQSGEYHCLFCHKTSPPNQLCSHIMTNEELATTPCKPACGKWYQATQKEKWEEEFDKFIDILPERVGETPREILKEFIRQHFVPKERVEEAIGNPPECLDILIDGKNIEQSQQYNDNKNWNNTNFY